jgi:hypothetical protein
LNLTNHGTRQQISTQLSLVKALTRPPNFDIQLTKSYK